MTDKEKGILLKETIKRLYENEGRSISYINRLLDISRHVISSLIKEWGFSQGNPLKRKRKEFLVSNKEYILARIKDGWTQREIYTSLNIGRIFYLDAISRDKEIQEAMKLTSYRDKEKVVFIKDEKWKPIKDYENYEISNYGRVRNKTGLIKTQINPISGYVTVGLYKNGKRKGYRVHRLVALAFCKGYSKNKNQVNHIDGDITNNKSSNLEWVSSSENLIHSYEKLNRIHKSGRSLDFIILYKNKYRFKTISSFAKFIDLSATQAARWIYEDPEKHDIEKIPK